MGCIAVGFTDRRMGDTVPATGRCSSISTNSCASQIVHRTFRSLDDVAGFEGTVDARGRSEVRIAVEGGAFSLAAVHIDPGTDVIWGWAAEGEEHCVVAEDGSYTSPEQAAGKYGLRFDGVGVSKYACTLYDGSDAMRGAVVVGDVFEGAGVLTVQELSVLGMFGVTITPPLALGAALWLKRRRERRGLHDVWTNREPFASTDERPG